MLSQNDIGLPMLDSGNLMLLELQQMFRVLPPPESWVERSSIHEFAPPIRSRMIITRAGIDLGNVDILTRDKATTAPGLQYQASMPVKLKI